MRIHKERTNDEIKYLIQIGPSHNKLNLLVWNDEIVYYFLSYVQCCVCSILKDGQPTVVLNEGENTYYSRSIEKKKTERKIMKMFVKSVSA